MNILDELAEQQMREMMGPKKQIPLNDKCAKATHKFLVDMVIATDAATNSDLVLKR